MFIEFEVVSSDSSKVAIHLNYNGESGIATYNRSTDSFDYTNSIDVKINEWRAILWLEKQMKNMINDNKSFDIYAVG